MHCRTGALPLPMDAMSPTPTWFLYGLRWYVLLPATVLVSLTAPHAPRLVPPDAGAGLAEGGAYGSIMGRNAFQRPRAEAIKLLSDLMEIFRQAP